VLAYIQIGTFVLVVTFHSWFFSTFFFTSLLKIIRPDHDCMLDFKDRITSVFSRRKSNQDEGDNAAIANGHSEDITFSKPGENSSEFTF
jgi:hypothetical protein